MKITIENFKKPLTIHHEEYEAYKIQFPDGYPKERYIWIYTKKQEKPIIIRINNKTFIQISD